MNLMKLSFVDNWVVSIPYETGNSAELNVATGRGKADSETVVMNSSPWAVEGT